MLKQDNICRNVYFDYQQKNILMRINASLDHLYKNLVREVVSPFLNMIGNELNLEPKSSMCSINILDSLQRTSLDETLSYYDLGVVYLNLNVYNPFVEVYGKRYYFTGYFEILPDDIENEFTNFKRKLIQYWWEIRRIRLLCSPEMFQFGRHFSLDEFNLLKINGDCDAEEKYSLCR
ncbi:hypothetical protein [Proteus mirabilis]|uniref:hypothetical protein n=1 Tax=Proteus mirabilis TaxID=584 RepID=UPI0034D607CA